MATDRHTGAMVGTIRFAERTWEAKSSTTAYVMTWIADQIPRSEEAGRLRELVEDNVLYLDLSELDSGRRIVSLLSDDLPALIRTIRSGDGPASPGLADSLVDLQQAAQSQRRRNDAATQAAVVRSQRDYAEKRTRRRRSAIVGGIGATVGVAALGVSAYLVGGAWDTWVTIALFVALLLPVMGAVMLGFFSMMLSDGGPKTAVYIALIIGVIGVPLSAIAVYLGAAALAWRADGLTFYYPIVALGVGALVVACLAGLAGVLASS